MNVEVELVFDLDGDEVVGGCVINDGVDCC